MKNKKRLNQKIQNKRNKRKPRIKLSPPSPFPLEIKLYGFKSEKFERVKLSNINHSLNEHQNQTEEEWEKSVNPKLMDAYLLLTEGEQSWK